MFNQQEASVYWNIFVIGQNFTLFKIKTMDWGKHSEAVALW